MDEKTLNRPVTVALFAQEQYDGEWMPDDLMGAVAWLQAFLDQMPVEYRDTAEIEISSVGGYEGEHSASIQISYRRPPTDAEKQGLLNDEHRQSAANKAERHRQYLRLKTEFGD